MSGKVAVITLERGLIVLYTIVITCEMKTYIGLYFTSLKEFTFMFRSLRGKDNRV